MYKGDVGVPKVWSRMGVRVRSVSQKVMREGLCLRCIG